MGAFIAPKMKCRRNEISHNYQNKCYRRNHARAAMIMIKQSQHPRSNHHKLASYAALFIYRNHCIMA